MTVETRFMLSDFIHLPNGCDVKVVQCNAFLLGIVGSEKEISKAVEHAKSVKSVRSVISYMELNN